MVKFPDLSGQTSLLEFLMPEKKMVQSMIPAQKLELPRADELLRDAGNCPVMQSPEILQELNIKTYGSKAACKKTEQLLLSLPLTKVEAKDRLLIQDILDAHTGLSSVSYNGNTVYPSKKLVKEFETFKRTGSIEKMTKAMYLFLSLDFDIAHYNQQGYIDYYDGKWSRLQQECLNYACRRIPAWKSDVRRIVERAKI